MTLRLSDYRKWLYTARAVAESELAGGRVPDWADMVRGTAPVGADLSDGAIERVVLTLRQTPISERRPRIALTLGEYAAILTEANKSATPLSVWIGEAALARLALESGG